MRDRPSVLATIVLQVLLQIGIVGEVEGLSRTSPLPPVTHLFFGAVGHNEVVKSIKK